MTPPEPLPDLEEYGSPLTKESAPQVFEAIELAVQKTIEVRPELKDKLENVKFFIQPGRDNVTAVRAGEGTHKNNPDLIMIDPKFLLTTFENKTELMAALIDHEIGHLFGPRENSSEWDDEVDRISTKKTNESIADRFAAQVFGPEVFKSVVEHFPKSKETPIFQTHPTNQTRLENMNKYIAHKELLNDSVKVEFDGDGNLILPSNMSTPAREKSR